MKHVLLIFRPIGEKKRTTKFWLFNLLTSQRYHKTSKFWAFCCCLSNKSDMVHNFERIFCSVGWTFRIISKNEFDCHFVDYSGKFSLFGSAIKRFVSFLVAVKAYSSELSLLVLVISGRAVILAFVRAWGEFIEEQWLLCSHELLVMIPSLDNFSNFIDCFILFACCAEVILYSDWQFPERKLIDILIGFRVECLFCCLLEVYEVVRDIRVGGHIWDIPIGIVIPPWSRPGHILCGKSVRLLWVWFRESPWLFARTRWRFLWGGLWRTGAFVLPWFHSAKDVCDLRSSVRSHCNALSVLGRWDLSREQCILLEFPVDHGGNIRDCIRQLCHGGLIVIILRMFVIRGYEIVHRGGSVESVTPVWVLVDSCRHVVPVTWRTNRLIILPRTGRFTNLNRFHLSPTRLQST